VVLAAGIVQFAIDTAAVLLVDSFLDVILNYAPVIVLLLAMSAIGLKKGTGSWAMIAGILVLFLASGIQAMGVDTLTPLDHNGLYHVVSMAGVAFLYVGGKRLKDR
jgi:Na+/serine symporter